MVLTGRHSLLAGFFLPATLIIANAQAQWMAYNDCLLGPGEFTAVNVSSWTIHNGDTSQMIGRLTDFDTGDEVGMPIVRFTMGQGGVFASGAGSVGNPVPGTDAYTLFNGIIDFSPSGIRYGDPGWWVEIEFYGLNPTKRYTFAATSIRLQDYADRVTQCTLMDAVEFINNSTDGVVLKTPETTQFQAGNNSLTGHVVRWDDIVPSAFGTFKVRTEAAPGFNDRAYALGGFMLQETGGIGNRRPSVDAGDYEDLVWPLHTLQLNPDVFDDDPCGLGLLVYRWTQLAGPADITFEPNPDFRDPKAIFPEPGVYELQLEVRDELDQTSFDGFEILIKEPLLVGDLDGNHRVNWYDLVIFSAQWLDDSERPANLNAGGRIDFRDLAMLAGNWRSGTGVTLVINEILARNDLSHPDPQGEYEDWIEIINTGEESIDLGGMYLTTDLTNPTRWQIPRDRSQTTMVPAGGYLLIWADNDLGDEGLHAPFQINAESGDEIGLFESDGFTLVDSITFGEQTSDVSYGRSPDGAHQWVTLTPTPGASNNDAFLSVVANVIFSRERGFYDAPFAVTLHTPTPDAMIRYTLDGTLPTEQHGLLYTEPVQINTTAYLRVGAFKSAWKATPIVTQTYLFLDHVLKQATHPVTGQQSVPEGYPGFWVTAPGDYQVDPDVVGQNGEDIFGGKYAATIIEDLKSVPTVSLVMPKDDWFGPRGIYIHKSQDGTERVCSIEFIDPNGQTHHVNMAIAMQGGVSGSGTSLNRWIKTFKLSMRPRFKPQIDDGTPTGGPPNVEFIYFSDSPVRQYDTIVLDAVHNYSWLHSWEDGSSEQRPLAMYIQDQYIADLHNTMGGHSPHGSYAHLYINGLYWGVYYLHERPDHAWAAQMRGGDKDEYDAIKHGSAYVINNGIGGSATANYNAMVQAARAVADDPSNPDRYKTLTQRLDIDNFITYLLANWYGANHDWPGKNWYATHRSPDGQWWFHSWDAEKVLNDSIPVGQSPSGLHNMLDNNSEYRMRFADLIYRYFFNDGPLSYPTTAQLYVMRMNQIERALVGESARWGDSRRSLPYTLEEWIATQEDKLNDYFPQRSERVLDRLKAVGLYPNFDPPVFLVNRSEHRGGHVTQNTLVTLSGEGDEIFYTTDGTDPWQALGGRFSPDPERVYTEPISLQLSTHFKTRAYRNNTWSALNEAIFAVGPVAEYLRLTEMMYHPLQTGRPGDPNAEFIELQNIGTETLNLNLIRFTDGVEFTFPSIELASGQFILVVKDVNAFTAYYGSGHRIAGQYVGSLNNAGERIELQDAAGRVIHDFEFKDGWYDSTDGKGYSLVVIDPVGLDPSHWNNKESWRSSKTIGGSPGSIE